MALFIIILLLAVMFFLFAYFILKKQYYGLISGFWAKPEEEQKMLIERGYPQATGWIMFNSGLILLVAALLYLVKVPYVLELSLVVMFMYMFGHLLVVNKMESKKVRKRNFYILIGSIILIVGISATAFIPTHLTVTEDAVKISGMYGVTWEFDEITTIEKVDSLPTINMRTNGISVMERRVGHFRLEELGGGRLFLQSLKGPFIYIEKGDDFLFINGKEPSITNEWFTEMENGLAN
ncbi:DUF3784 domain-containing protein [Alkalihalobacillus sp. 1P02AB]|uniref:DUF3784 domain-containing protein n=1 Tax=Alkalihalobacillus sp. 1P02AB TaxID=3132260 RepID=UPI0039A6DB30